MERDLVPNPIIFFGRLIWTYVTWMIDKNWDDDDGDRVPIPISLCLFKIIRFIKKKIE